METATPKPIDKTLKNSFRLFLIDLKALPEEVYDKSFGPKVRTIADIVYEVNEVNDEIVRVIRNEWAPLPPDEGWLKAPEGLRTKEAVIAAFQKSSETALATIEAFTLEQMEAKVKNREGEATRMEECRFMNLHVWYHLGQLNYVQTLVGDDAWHWA